ncbi:MAG: type II toxin-antitoxin system RelE/ParE family toxin [Candidatus Omnitrophota bacterium]
MSKPYSQSAYPKYNRLKKKFPAYFIKKLNEAEDDAALKLLIGEEKTNALKGIRVYKFKVLDLIVLLAYQVNQKQKEVIFVAVGGHENFYRELQQYL